jgi:hypothetical protein
MYALRCRERGMACVQSFPPALQSGCYGVSSRMPPVVVRTCWVWRRRTLPCMDMARSKNLNGCCQNFERVNAGREKRVPLYGPYFGAVCTVFSLRGFKKRHPFFGTCRSELGFGRVRAADNAGKGSHLARWMFRRNERQSMATPSAIF